MAGTKAGGLKAAAKNKANDPDFYKKIGQKGGRNGHTGGFYANPKLAKRAGAKGGRKSSRGKALEIDGVKIRRDGTIYKKSRAMLSEAEARRLEKASQNLATTLCHR